MKSLLWRGWRLSSAASRNQKLLGLWIVICFALAVLVLVNSIREYRFVSRRIMRDEVRRDLGHSAVSLEHDLQRAATNRGAINFQSTVEKHLEANENRGWLHLRTMDGHTFAKAGMDVPNSFSGEQIQESLRDHEPLFTTRQTAAGEALVELFVLHIHPPRIGAAPPPPFSPQRARRMPSDPPMREMPLLEIGMPLSDIRAQFWPLRRGLIIDLAAAIALLTSVVLVAFRYRAFDRARQLEQQLQIAREVQQALLPDTRHVADWVRVAAECVPAWQVGGDFYDMYAVGQGMALILGDVSGKGIPAALLAGLVHGATRTRDWYFSAANHEEAARDLNELLLERAAGDRYTTLFWCYYDHQAQVLHYLNAGHCPPLLVRRDSRVLRLEEGGTVLGLIPGADYRQARVSIEPGDLLTIYSDGVVEAANAQDEEFGDGRLAQVLQRHLSDDVEELRERITASVRGFAGPTPLADDLTFLLARFEPAAARLSEGAEAAVTLQA